MFLEKIDLAVKALLYDVPGQAVIDPTVMMQALPWLTRSAICVAYHYSQKISWVSLTGHLGWYQHQRHGDTTTPAIYLVLRIYEWCIGYV